MSSKAASPCDERQLKVLLHGDEDSDEYIAAAGHIEGCTACQTRLGKLAGDEDSWRELRELLSDEVMLNDDASSEGYGNGSTVPRMSLGEIESASLDVLSPPSHPEMLGRIGRYEVEKAVGSGGMGVVLKGHDTELNRPVAIKVLASHLAHSGAARQRFAREGRAAAAVMHEHVVAIHNVEVDGDAPYLVMQYVPGQSLQARVDEQGPFDPKEVLRVGIQVASGLAAAHTQGLVHRDIKPSNILLENDVERALLTDFGLARVVDDASMTRTGIVAGTPHYMSPEQASGEPVDFRSDLFSLGAVLYFMCTGRPPFRAERAMAVLNRICRHRHRPAWEVNPDIPDDLSNIIDRLLEKKPNRRFAGAAQVQESLAGILAKLQQPNRSRIGSRWKRCIRRHRRALSLAMFGAVLLASVIVFGVVHRRDTTDDTSDRRNLSGGGPSVQGDTSVAPSAIVVGALDAGMASAAQFDAEFRALQTDLQQLEASSGSRGSHYWQQSISEWHIQIQTIKRDLSRLEQSGFDNSQPKGEE